MSSIYFFHFQKNSKSYINVWTDMLVFYHMSISSVFVHKGIFFFSFKILNFWYMKMIHGKFS